MKIETLQNASADSYLRLDPRTKLFIMVFISIFMMSGRIVGIAVIPRVVLAAVPAVLLLTGGKRRAAALYALGFAAGVLTEQWLINSTGGIVSILFTMLSGLITRFMPCMVMGYYLMTTTKVSEFIAAMERMRMPVQITIPLAVMFRFIPTIGEESRAINDAMRMRGIGIRGGNALAMLEYRLVPLMMSVVRIGDELSASALTRGLGGPDRRTNIATVGFSVWDAVFAAIVAASGILYKVL